MVISVAYFSEIQDRRTEEKRALRDRDRGHKDHVLSYLSQPLLFLPFLFFSLFAFSPPPSFSPILTLCKSGAFEFTVILLLWQA